jgi:hypothetical protein
MSNLYWLSDKHVSKLEPLLQKFHVDDGQLLLNIK